MVVDTHASAGLYRLDGDTRKPVAKRRTAFASARRHRLAPALRDYVDLVAAFAEVRPQGLSRLSLVAHRLREHDKLKLIELHPTDARTLAGNIASWRPARLPCCAMTGLRRQEVLPPPSRRALVLYDPSYEIKTTGYAKVVSHGGRCAEALCHGHLRRLVPDHSPPGGA